MTKRPALQLVDDAQKAQRQGYDPKVIVETVI